MDKTSRRAVIAFAVIFICLFTLAFIEMQFEPLKTFATWAFNELGTFVVGLFE